MYNNYLCHYGVLGMRWGHSKGGTSASSNRKTRKANEAKSLTDQELRERINRLQMERQYKDLTATSGQKAISKGKKIVGGIMLGSATALASKYTKRYMEKGLEYVGKAALKNGAKVVGWG